MFGTPDQLLPRRTTTLESGLPIQAFAQVVTLQEMATSCGGLFINRTPHVQCRATSQNAFHHLPPHKDYLAWSLHDIGRLRHRCARRNGKRTQHRLARSGASTPRNRPTYLQAKVPR